MVFELAELLDLSVGSFMPRKRPGSIGKDPHRTTKAGSMTVNSIVTVVLSNREGQVS